MTYAGSWFGAVPSVPPGTGSAGQFGALTAVTLDASGYAAKPGTGSRNLSITSNDGAADTLTRITGYSEGDMVLISPTSDSVTITVTNDDDYLNLQGVDFTMDDINDSMILLNKGSDKWRELSRAGN